MAAKFKDTDHGWKAIYARLEAAANAPILLTVGIHEEDDVSYEGGESLLDVAEAHEFGLGVPRRSFIADWADENEEKNKQLISKMAQAIAAGKVEIEDGLDRLGLRFVGDIQKRIRAGIEPANSPSVIAKKGSSTPLIDTGQLWGAIRHKVEVNQ